MMRSRWKGWRVLPGSATQPAVFEECLLPHLDHLYGLAVRLTRDAGAAEDLLQDAVLRAFEKFKQLRNPAAARPWFVRILTRVFLNHYSARSQESEPLESLAVAHEETPEAVLLRRSNAEEVESALAELPDGFRVAVLLADVEELPLREIAAICGCPVGTVASRLARGRRLLRERLAHLRRAREVGV